MQLTFFTFGKMPNRMPESMWLTFKPQTSTTPEWILEKVNQVVSATDVISGGGRRMHAVTSHLTCNDGGNRLEITTLDAPVVALGTRSPLNYSKSLPDLHDGVHINLFNNAWGPTTPSGLVETGCIDSSSRTDAIHLPRVLVQIVSSNRVEWYFCGR
jgi:hypothetical protein